MSRHLPPLLQEIAEAISLDVALKLAEAKGGQRITIPARVHSDHWLVKLLGMEEAKALSFYFTHGSSVYLDIPFGPTSDSARKQALFDKMQRQGKSANEIAAACHTTRRNVFYKLAKVKKAKPRDPDLFDQNS